jgi:predicted phage terminase large subunit-like protein
MDDIEAMLPPLEDIEAELAVRSLAEFNRLHWKYVDTSSYVHGWHVDCIAEHLEAVTDGDIRRLIINIPPRNMKSLSTAVFWPAWSWLIDPGIRWLFSSYSQTLSTRDSVKCRRVIQSPRYQQIMRYVEEVEERVTGDTEEPFSLTGDQNTKIRFENNKGGYRLSTSTTGLLTGEGGDIIVVDDAHNVIEGESDAQRKKVLTWWDESMSTRLNDPRTGAYVIIMQRVHQNDLVGHILKRIEDRGLNLGEDAKSWHKLCLPARYEGENTIFTGMGWEDPRTEVDEPLWEERYGDEELKEVEENMTEYARACQLQQRPAPRGGGMFKVERIGTVPSVHPTQVISATRYWDKAGTDGGGCLTAGVLLLEMKSGDFRWVVDDVITGQWSYGRREDRIKQTVELDEARYGKKKLKTYTEQEGGSGGKESAERTIDNLSGYRVYADPVKGDKTLRAEGIAAQVEGSNVAFRIAPWNVAFIEELEMFPNSTFKDRTDSLGGAFNKATKKRKRRGTWRSKQEKRR